MSANQSDTFTFQFTYLGSPLVKASNNISLPCSTLCCTYLGSIFITNPPETRNALGFL